MNRAIASILVVALIVAGIWYSVVRARPTEIVSGTIEADETHIGSKIGGRVLAIHTQEGTFVKKDQLLVEFDATELQARRDAAAAAVESAKAQLDEAKHGPLPREIKQSLETWQSLLANADLARKTLARTKELYESKVASSEELDRDIKQSEAADAQAAAAEQQYNRLKEGTRPEKIAQAHAELAQLNAKLAEAETLLREMRVVSPADATLEILHVKAGDIVAPNRPIATLLLATPLWVRVYVREEWLTHIALGDAAEVRVDAFPDETFAGKVVQVARKAEFTPRNVQTDEERARQLFAVKIEFIKLDPRLRAGMTAKATFPKAPKNSSP